MSAMLGQPIRLNEFGGQVTSHDHGEPIEQLSFAVEVPSQT